MEKITVKPGQDGLKVRDPKHMDLIEAEGREVVMSTYWSRRIKCGDVVVVPAAAEAAEASKAESKGSKQKNGGAEK